MFSLTNQLTGVIEHLALKTTKRTLFQVIGIYTGVNAGEDEEIYDDSVVQSDTKGILGSWKAKDTESGIQEYKVCVGTKVGKYQAAFNLAMTYFVGSNRNVCFSKCFVYFFLGINKSEIMSRW